MRRNSTAPDASRTTLRVSRKIPRVPLLLDDLGRRGIESDCSLPTHGFHQFSTAWPCQRLLNLTQYVERHGHALQCRSSLDLAVQRVRYVAYLNHACHQRSMNSCFEHVKHVESRDTAILGKTPPRGRRACPVPLENRPGRPQGSPLRCQSEAFQELDHQRDAFLRLFELQEVSCPRHEVAVETIERIEIKARPEW